MLIQNDTRKIFHSDRGLLLHTTMKGNRMFYLTSSMNPRKSQCLHVSEVSKQEAQLCHKRFAHLNFQGLCTLANKHLVIGLPPLKSPKEICTLCIIGKQHSSWRALRKLQLIHVDVCGPISPLSNNNKRYILIFIDDYSRKTWVYFMHAKSETFIAFQKFQSLCGKRSQCFHYLSKN